MKVTAGTSKSIVLFRSFKAGSTASMTLTGADNSVVELTGENARVQRFLAVYSIPAQYITDQTLPLNVDLKVNGESLRSVDLTNSREPENAGTVYEVLYAEGWGPRPTDDASIVVSWYGGTVDTPPTAALPGMDKWFVPNTSGSETD